LHPGGWRWAFVLAVRVCGDRPKSRTKKVVMITSILIGIKFMIRFIKGLFSPAEVEPIREFSNEEFEKLKFKARIALIDDDEISHVRRLQKDGYNIVDLSDITEIDDFIRKKYDVVVLDIQGVGKDLSQNSEGWGILKYLKTECPHLVVIMFTGADWSVTKYKHLVDMADDFIGKDLEFLDFKSKLDSGIRKAFSPKFHLEVERKRIIKEISNADTFDRISSIVNTYGRNKKRALKEVRKVTNKEEIIQSVSSYLAIIDSITSLLT